VPFLKSRQRGTGRSAGAKLLCPRGRSGIGSGIAPKPLRCVSYLPWHFTSPRNKLSPVPRLAFIAGGADSNVSGCVCLPMSITFSFDYNLAERGPLAFAFCRLCVSSLFSFWKLSREGFSRCGEQGSGRCPSYIRPRRLPARSPAPQRTALTVLFSKTAYKNPRALCCSPG